MPDWRGKPSLGMCSSGVGGAGWNWGSLVAELGSPGAQREPLADTELPRIKSLEFLWEAARYLKCLGKEWMVLKWDFCAADPILHTLPV